MIAGVRYTLTIGTHDPTVMRDSLIADIGIPLLLLAVPAFFARPPAPASW